jgi:hypothetical protein
MIIGSTANYLYTSFVISILNEICQAPDLCSNKLGIRGVCVTNGLSISYKDGEKSFGRIHFGNTCSVYGKEGEKP